MHCCCHYHTVERQGKQSDKKADRNVPFDNNYKTASESGQAKYEIEITPTDLVGRQMKVSIKVGKNESEKEDSDCTAGDY